MPISGQQVAKLTTQGIVFTCATCEHLQSAIDSGRPGCGKPAGECGSPLNENTFPKYQGILDDEYMRYVCWVCGQESRFGLHFVRTGRTLGVCEDHRKEHEKADSPLDCMVIVG